MHRWPLPTDHQPRAAPDDHTNKFNYQYPYPAKRPASLDYSFQMRNAAAGCLWCKTNDQSDRKTYCHYHQTHNDPGAEEVLLMRKIDNPVTKCFSVIQRQMDSN